MLNGFGDTATIPARARPSACGTQITTPVSAIRRKPTAPRQPGQRCRSLLRRSGNLCPGTAGPGFGSQPYSGDTTAPRLAGRTLRRTPQRMVSQ
jgi:hypothetical protein